MDDRSQEKKGWFARARTEVEQEVGTDEPTRSVMKILEEGRRESKLPAD